MQHGVFINTNYTVSMTKPTCREADRLLTVTPRHSICVH